MFRCTLLEISRKSRRAIKLGFMKLNLILSLRAGVALDWKALAQALNCCKPFSCNSSQALHHASKRSDEIKFTKAVCCAGRPWLTSATAADVQPLVEFFIQLLLPGIVYRDLLLFGLFRRRARRKPLGAGLQMADRCAAWHHGRRDASHWTGSITDCTAEYNGADEDGRDHKT
jgi:hypothetical protein